MAQHLALRSGNPALTADTFRGTSSADSGVMTVAGTVNKTALALAILLVTASYTWSLEPGAAGGWMALGVLGGLGVALVTIFKKEWAPFTTPAYAALEGLALGGISAIFEARYPGI